MPGSSSRSDIGLSLADNVALATWSSAWCALFALVFLGGFWRAEAEYYPNPDAVRKGLPSFHSEGFPHRLLASALLIASWSLVPTMALVRGMPDLAPTIAAAGPVAAGLLLIHRRGLPNWFLLCAWFFALASGLGGLTFSIWDIGSIVSDQVSY